MEQKRTFDWAQERIDLVTGLNRKDRRESQARQRRLNQMEKARQKAIKQREAEKAKP